MNFDSPILIVGPPRSGTSMISGAISLCGAWEGPVSPPVPHNPKGMFENLRLSTIVYQYLNECGYDPLGQRPLPPREGYPLPDNWKDWIKMNTYPDGYDGGPWAFKNCKNLLIWRLWDKHFPRARWIFVKRPVEKVVSSCMNAPFMAAYVTPEGWGEMVSGYYDRFADLSAKRHVITVESEEVARNVDSLKPVIEELGLQWNKEELDQFISPSLLRLNSLGGGGSQGGTG